MEYKIPVVGDSNVGKTSLVNKYAFNRFNDPSLPTVGVANNQILVRLQDRLVNLNVWDTAGQEKYRSLVPLYTKGAHLILIVFDLTDRDSFAGLDEWLKIAREQSGNKCPIIVAANKHDMIEDFAIDISDAKAWANEHDCQFICTSAKTGENVQALFQEIAMNVDNSIATEKERVLVPPKEGKSCC